jgi:hypothetical protein
VWVVVVCVAVGCATVVSRVVVVVWLTGSCEAHALRKKLAVKQRKGVIRISFFIVGTVVSKPIRRKFRLQMY